MKKPSNIIYGVEESPPLFVTILNGMQHVALIAINLVYPLLVFRAAGTSVDAIANLLAIGMLVLGAATVLQAQRMGPVGSGYLCPSTFTATYLPSSLLAARLGGLPLGGVTVVVGVSTLIVAAVSDGWRFVPAAHHAGAVADLLAARLAGPIRRLAVATALPSAYAAFVLLTVAVTTGLGWSITLALGVVLAAGLIGFGLAIASFARSRIAERS